MQKNQSASMPFKVQKIILVSNNQIKEIKEGETKEGVCIEKNQKAGTNTRISSVWTLCVCSCLSYWHICSETVPAGIYSG